VGKHEDTRQRVISGSSDANIDFDDLCAMLRNADFKCRKGKGSHMIFSRKGIREIINLQPDKNGKAKKYQIKQVRQLFEGYDL
jgi:predicted RNA binding protein YcfA (HicA-like mRNA interferase family)